MNIYTTDFFANCPNNGIRIAYKLRIESSDVVPVEQIIAAVDCIGDGYHEDIADGLAASLGGVQTLTADHHGVRIETIRQSSNDKVS